MRKKRTPASAKIFRWVCVLLVAATLVAGWRFYKTYGKGQKPSAGSVEQSEPTARLSTDPMQSETQSQSEVETVPVTDEVTEEPTTEPQGPTVSTVTLLAVGDNLIHNTVYESGWDTDPWNYDHLYQYVAPDIQAADIAVINQETIFVKDHKYCSNYPCFGTPREIGDAVYKAGFDVILHATNHVMDMGIDNIYDAIDYWSDKDVTVLGIHKKPNEPPVILEKNGIKIGMLNYVYGMNGFELPAGNEYAVDLLAYQDKLKSDIAYLEEHADITVGFFHVGQEYSIVPTADAEQVVEMACNAGVDIMINCHPHVLQPYGIYTSSNGNQALVYWSLGNFISAQTRLDSLIGGMATLTIQKTVDGDTTVTEVTDYDLTPLVTHTAKDKTYAVYKLEDYTDELGAKNFRYQMTTAEAWKRFYQIVGEPED